MNTRCLKILGQRARTNDRKLRPVPLIKILIPVFEKDIFYTRYWLRFQVFCTR